jgi:hypothetical protein
MTLGAAKRIWEAPKASISRRSAWRCKIGRARRCRGKFAADDECCLQHIDNTLHLERLDEIGADIRVVEELLADALDGLAHGLDVGHRLQMKVELHHRPVAAVIGD